MYYKQIYICFGDFFLKLKLNLNIDNGHISITHLCRYLGNPFFSIPFYKKFAIYSLAKYLFSEIKKNIQTSKKSFYAE